MSNDWNKATAKLIDQTRDGQIHWFVATGFPASRDPDDVVVKPAYFAVVANKQIAVYKYRYCDNDEHGYLVPDDIAIEFVDEDLQRTWLWPATERRAELFEVIQQQTSGADDFLRDFIGQEH